MIVGIVHMETCESTKFESRECESTKCDNVNDFYTIGCDGIGGDFVLCKNGI